MPWPGTTPAIPGRLSVAEKRVQLPFTTAEGDGPEILWGLGSPEGVVVGSPPDFYLDETNGIAYLKQTGEETNTGWVAMGDASTLPNQHIVDGWYRDNVADSQTAVALARYANGPTPAKWLCLRAGSVVGICVQSNEARTAGTLTVQVTGQDSGTLSAVLNGTNTIFKATAAAVNAVPFSAGDELGIQLDTDASWAPTTADIKVSIEVEL